MWLLDTEHVSLRYFDKPPSRYAILSHVWQAGEQDFHSIGPYHNLTPKIRACCHHARLQGFNWIWVDTCCIDKTNSVELSEAINSMYKWYANATICFAYLYDVDISENPAATNSTFRRSVWFTRGWTLQELIAPRAIVFFSKDWKVLGTKDFLADLLEDITGIDVSVLTSRVQLSSISIAQRLSWASWRNTTRVEDAAYSLMGLFDINMPTIYGEGPRAFRRLQEEIMKTSPDHTLFTWGPTLTLSTNTRSSDNSVGLTATPGRSPTQTSRMDSYLLASSANSFAALRNTPLPVTLSHDDFITFLKAFNVGDMHLGGSVDEVRSLSKSRSYTLFKYFVLIRQVLSLNSHSRGMAFVYTFPLFVFLLNSYKSILGELGNMVLRSLPATYTFKEDRCSWVLSFAVHQAPISTESALPSRVLASSVISQ